MTPETLWGSLTAQSDILVVMRIALKQMAELQEAAAEAAQALPFHSSANFSAHTGSYSWECKLCDRNNPVEAIRCQGKGCNRLGPLEHTERTRLVFGLISRGVTYDLQAMWLTPEGSVVRSLHVNGQV
jgi:hypothetical protein